MATLDIKPMVNDSPSNEIINTEKYVPINNENPYLVLLDKQKSSYTIYKSNSLLIILMFLCCLIFGILIGPILIISLYGLIIDFAFLIIIYVFLLYFNDKRITFIKDESNNQLNIVVTNYFCCSKKTTILCYSIISNRMSFSP